MSFFCKLTVIEDSPSLESWGIQGNVKMIFGTSDLVMQFGYLSSDLSLDKYRLYHSS